MKIRFRQTGGFAGLVRGCDLDTKTLPAAEALKIAELLQRSEILNLARSPHAIPDAFEYEIAVEEDAAPARSIVFDDATVPEAARDLLRYLKTQSHPVPLD